MFIRLLTSIVLSFGLVLSTGGIARAGGLDRTDLARAVFGLATVAIIAKAIDGNDKRDEAARRQHSLPRYGSDEYAARPAPGVRVIDGTVSPARPFHRGPKAHRGYKAEPLPAICRVTVTTERGQRPAFSHPCLDRNYKFASKLPDACETLVRTPQGYRSVYGSRCLDRDGWRISSR